MGPLSRLRLFGLVCPCHESDDEYNARIAFSTLQKVRIHWYRISSQQSWEQSSTIMLDAVLSIVDCNENGPSLQVHSRDPNRLVNTFSSEHSSYLVEQTNKQVLLRIPLVDIGNVELVDTEYHSEIQVYDVHQKTRLLLQFTLSPKQQGYCLDWLCCYCIRPLQAETVVHYLQAVIYWDGERRRDTQDRIERHQARQRLRDESRRLVTDAQAARMAMV